MAETDLSKIVNLIMENPKLIEEIKNLGAERNEAEKAAPVIQDITVAETETAVEAERKVTYESVSSDTSANHIRRKDLLLALKPYVSEERGRAIDSMMSIADILDMMRSK